MAIDDIPDVADGCPSAGEIQVTAEIYDGLASGADPVAQLQQRGSLRIVLCYYDCFVNGSWLSNAFEHHGLPPQPAAPTPVRGDSFPSYVR